MRLQDNLYYRNRLRSFREAIYTKEAAPVYDTTSFITITYTYRYTITKTM